MTSPTRREFLGGTLALMSAASVRLPLWAQTVASLAGIPAAGPLLLGVDYYPDQTSEALWEEDARMIADFGFTNVRIAEFAWALMEPSEGKFDFAWLRRSIDILHKHNIAVILGTPSAAPPPWLTAKYPDIVEVNEKGERLHPGGRRFTCPTNQVYRRLSLIIASEMARTFVDTPGVIGWQIDNEFTLGSSQRCYCNYCQAGFQTWLRSRYSQPGQPESELGNSLLEPDLYGFQPDPGAVAVRRRSESRTRSRLRSLPVLCQRFLPAGTVGHAAQDVSAAFRYDE